MSKDDENLKDSDLQALARDFVQLADNSVFNFLAPDTAKVLNKLVDAKEAGLKALFDLIESGKLRETHIQSIILTLDCIGCDLANYNEETGQILISYLEDTLFSSKSTDTRRVAFSLLGELLEWVFPEKKASIDAELLPLLFDESLAIRFAMINYVKDYRIKAAIPHLIILLSAPEDGHTYRILQTLQKFDEPEALLAIEEWEKQRN